MRSTHRLSIGLAAALAAGAIAGCGGDEAADGTGSAATTSENAELPLPEFTEVAFQGALEHGDEQFGEGWALTSAYMSANTVGLEVAEGGGVAQWTYRPQTDELSESGPRPERVDGEVVEYEASELDPAVARQIVARGLRGNPDYGLTNVIFEYDPGAKEPRWVATFNGETGQNVSVWASALDGADLRQIADAEQIRAKAERDRRRENKRVERRIERKFAECVAGQVATGGEGIEGVEKCQRIIDPYAPP